MPGLVRQGTPLASGCSAALFMNEHAGSFNINANIFWLPCTFDSNLPLGEVSRFAANVSFERPTLDEMEDTSVTFTASGKGEVQRTDFQLSHSTKCDFGQIN